MKIYKRKFESISLEKQRSSSGMVYRFNYENKGYLDFQEEDGTYFLIMVEVKDEYQNQKIATQLLDKFFDYVNKKEGALDVSGFLEEGEKYLKHVVDKLKGKYHNIYYL